MNSHEAAVFPPTPGREPRLIVASGNPKKVEAYQAYPGIISSLDPESDCGQPEPEIDNAATVAWMKTEAVRRVCDALWPEENSYIYLANDVRTLVSRSLKGLYRPGQHREMLKLNRYFPKIKSNENLEKFMIWAELDTLNLYCNGQFFVMWELGTAVQLPSHQISVASNIRIIGCFNPLAESEVMSAFDDGSAYTIGPRVQLAELSEQYASEVYIDSQDKKQMLQYAKLQSLVVQGVLPWSSFARLLEVTSEMPAALPASVPYQHVPVVVS